MHTPLVPQKRHSESEQFERIPVTVFPDADGASAAVARRIAEVIRERNGEGKPAVLGLATGSTPVRLYRELVRLHREEGLSFRNVVTFNLDEYYGLGPDHPQSYRHFMQEHLFSRIDLPEENAHVPSGTVDRREVYAHCLAYEEKIRALGGIDLQILGIGRTGHIGFNEPGSGPASRTRLVSLDPLTRRDAARDFLGEAHVPRHAITMGIGTILEAAEIHLLAWGWAKAGIVAAAVEGPEADTLPASYLQRHAKAAVVADAGAASALIRFDRPWLAGAVEDWSPRMVRKAVAWMGETLGKPVLKIVDEEYNHHKLGDLLTEAGPAYSLNIRVFNELQHTITGWPGGKPGADDVNRPVPASPPAKRVLVLSPEPLDAERGMGGTLQRLVEQGHEVTLVHQTSGSLAVPDEQALLSAEFLLEWGEGKGSAALVRDALRAKRPFDPDSAGTRRLKAFIRRSEARAAAAICGIDPGRVRFLDLPFYEEGHYRRFHPTDRDAARMKAVLDEIEPHMVFATGLGGDPSSVPFLCFRILLDALAAGPSGEGQSSLWLYPDADRAWEPHEIDMAVPLSPRELEDKVCAVYRHLSQRSQVPATVAATREAWQETQELNRRIARRYDVLGLSEYEAIEAFRRWRA